MRGPFAFAFAGIGVVVFRSWAEAASTCPAPLGALVAIEGQVEFREHAGAAWRVAPLNVPLCPGAMVRVGDRSRATAALPDAPTYRIDQNTTFHLVSAPAKPERPAVIRLVEGALYIFSRRPRTLTINTPFVDAAVEGTEFLVRADRSRTAIAVFEGTVAARNAYGEARATAGQLAIAEPGRAPVSQLMVRPREAVEWALHYPPILTVLGDPRAAAAAEVPQPIRDAARRASRGDIPGALERLEAVPAAERGASFHLHRAAILLSVGRVDEARADIERALAQDPGAGLGYALRAVIAVAQNDTERALADGRRAVELGPQSAAAWIALSYAQQARFDLDGARDSLRAAVEAQPKDALAWARLSELWLMAGHRDRARQAAETAADLAPDLPRVQSVLGFAALAEFRTQTARQAFERAVARDPADPTSRFGLGLARIRRGDLETGRNDIEVAVGLDPNRSLLRSYLGKGYFEERTTNPLTYLKALVNNFPNQENTLAAEQFAIAKDLDPKDPTPFLYDAIRKQSENRPVEALRDIEKSIELNDNRAVYRSRELLDQDQAARGTSLARIYNDLGFEQLGVNEASQSLTLDPSNAAAHRFLSDIYTTQSRHEITRVSELLQAQLLQDININPVQPSLGVTNLNVITSGGPARPAFNEFTPLFERNQAQLNATGQIGNQRTRVDETVVSGVYDRHSLSAGQFHYETEGFRRNDDLNYDIYNFFAQTAIAPELNVQAEVRQDTSESGFRDIIFDPDVAPTEYVLRIRQNTGRFGARYSPTPQSTFLSSIISGDLDYNISNSPEPGADNQVTTDRLQGEAQYIYNDPAFSFVSGFGYFYGDAKLRSSSPSAGSSSDDYTDRLATAYAYSNIRYGRDVTWTLGIGLDNYRVKDLNLTKLNPKIGVQWQIVPSARLRLAAFRAVKPPILNGQTVQPTQVAGFSQFFDDVDGTEAWRYGGGIDLRITRDVSIDVEASQRQLQEHFIPLFTDDPDAHTQHDNAEERLFRGSVYWTIGPEWAVAAELVYDDYKREKSPRTEGVGIPIRVETWRAPLSVRYFHPFGFFGTLTGSFVSQEVSRQGDAEVEGKKIEGSSNFFLLDAAAGYRFPRRRGSASIRGINLLDKGFKYQDDSFRDFRLQPTVYRLVPGRTVIAGITLSF